ncbi:hypothetical protein BG842_04795 [Haladaptatus sp. W1]|uniref:SRPBCC family protein n=1 Tax=Haladaptatus sp. W1 TaxID=1897478 RepID=UPI000849C4BF|nr:SRPBCC family protein [Haladaptatus sp. W1]ODR81149.1 hypothetical protein BG842_04795 [Haladaptatus sp. W1]
MTDNKPDAQPIEEETTELRITRTIDTPRARIWNAWTDPEQVAKWWGPNGFTNTVHEMNVRPGGVWRFVMHSPDGADIHNEFVYDEIVEPERLVYTHPPTEANDFLRFQVTVTFDNGVDGGTDLTFRMDFDSASDRKTLEKFNGVEAAKQTLDCLAGFLANDGAGGVK